jgi:hypothetical protein
MEAIERLLHEAGERVVYALGPDGRRVHAGIAYAAVGTSSPIQDGDAVYLVECGGPWLDTPTAVRIDHHRPGDPGYGRPPREFMNASSLGQVAIHLAARGVSLPWRHQHGGGFWGNWEGPTWRWSDAAIAGVEHYDGGAWVLAHELADALVPPIEIILTAVADHCLRAAYLGYCPGVNPDALMRWRAEGRASFQRRPVAEVLADIERAIAALRAAPTVEIAGVAVADLGDATVPEAPEAACRLGIPFLAVVPDRDGRHKQVLQAAPAEVISAWMAIHPGSYGDPARGFAGRYL